MATITQELAEQLVKYDGTYPGDPQCYAVFKYYNPFFDKWCWAVAYNESDLQRYMEYRLEFLWRKDGKTGVLMADDDIEHELHS